MWQIVSLAKLWLNLARFCIDYIVMDFLFSMVYSWRQRKDKLFVYIPNEEGYKNYTCIECVYH